MRLSDIPKAQARLLFIVAVEVEQVIGPLALPLFGIVYVKASCAQWLIRRGL